MYRYYLYRNGEIIFGDDIAASDLAEAIRTVTALISLRHEAFDGYEVWSGSAMLYCAACSPDGRADPTRRSPGRSSNGAPLLASLPSRS